MFSARLRSNSTPSPSNCKPQIVPAEMITSAPIDILRFIDQIDCSLWTATHSEDVILNSIGACFTSKSAAAWYNGLVNSKRPRKPTINDIRRALLKDFSVENWEKIMARYEPCATTRSRDGGPSRGEGYEYYQTQEFKLRLSYLDEIEGLKDQIKFRNKRALNDGKKMNEMERMWEGILSKKNGKIEQLEIVAREFEKEAGDLKAQAKGKEKTAVGLSGSEEAFRRFEKSIEEARERLRRDLDIQSYEAVDYPENIKPCSITALSPRENSCPTLPPIKSVHWPNASSLENIFEVSPTPSPPPNRKRFFTRSPLKPLSKNANPGAPLPGLAFTKDDVMGPLECDDLLNDWDKELVLNRSGRSNFSPVL